MTTSDKLDAAMVSHDLNLPYVAVRKLAALGHIPAPLPSGWGEQTYWSRADIESWQAAGNRVPAEILRQWGC